MPTPIILKLDTKKMNRDWFFKGEKGTYIDLVCFENDNVDAYGNSHVIKQSPPREERDKGVKPIIVGNGKWMPQRGGPPQRQQSSRQQPPQRQQEDDAWGGDPSDQIPFHLHNCPFC